jgi:hypothetical protein
VVKRLCSRRPCLGVTVSSSSSRVQVARRPSTRIERTVAAVAVEREVRVADAGLSGAELLDRAVTAGEGGRGPQHEARQYGSDSGEPADHAASSKA